MQVYVEVSKNHGYSIGEVIRGRFTPEIRLLIIHYNHMFRLEQHENEKMIREMKKQENNRGGDTQWQKT
jgi:hypothetical protein